MSSLPRRDREDLSIPLLGALLVLAFGLLGWMNRKAPDTPGAESGRDERSSHGDGLRRTEVATPPPPASRSTQTPTAPQGRPPDQDEILALPVQRRFEAAAEWIRRARRDASADPGPAGAFAERLFYGLEIEPPDADGSPGPVTAEGVRGQAEIGAVARAFGEWMGLDSEGSIAWLATRSLPLSRAILEEVSLKAATTGSVDMAGWLEAFPAPIDLRTRAVWLYGTALLSAVGPEQAAAQLGELSFLSEDYALQIVTTAADAATARD